MKEEPAVVAQFITLVRSLVPPAVVTVDPPQSTAGEWFIDVYLGDLHLPVSWKPAYGFGFFTSPGHYGERPDELYGSAAMAAERVMQLQRTLTV